MRWLDGRKLGRRRPPRAISSTTATDGDLVIEHNFRLSLRLFEWCAATRTPFIYASSAATYGNGEAGFSDDWSPDALKRLKPANLYGWSKHIFDQAVVARVLHKDKVPPQWVGLKFFNVFGPNEYHKGEMMSLVAKRFDDAKAGRPIGCSSRSAPASPTASSGAISSMWMTRSPWYAGFSARRRSRASSTSAPERRAASAI